MSVALGFGKLHDIHALSRVPMQECLSLKHSRKLGEQIRGAGRSGHSLELTPVKVL